MKASHISLSNHYFYKNLGHLGVPILSSSYSIWHSLSIWNLLNKTDTYISKNSNGSRLWNTEQTDTHYTHTSTHRRVITAQWKESGGADWRLNWTEPRNSVRPSKTVPGCGCWQLRTHTGCRDGWQLHPPWGWAPSPGVRRGRLTPPGPGGLQGDRNAHSTGN